MKKTINFLLIALLPFLSFGQWNQVGADIDGEAEGDSFGKTSSLNATGDVMVAGSRDNETNGKLSGHTRVFDWDGTNWIQRGDAINGSGPNVWSGYEVSINGNGNTIASTSLVAPNASGLVSTGIVKVFDWDGASWVQRGANLEGDGDPNGFVEFFGYSIDLNDDGNTIAIGGPQVNGVALDTGIVRIYKWDGAAWIQQGEDIEGLVENDQLGFSVSLSADGTVVASGAPGNDSFSTNTNGVARIFEWDGVVWEQRGTDIEGLVSGDSFGKSIAISADGNVVAAGAPDVVIIEGNIICTARVFEWGGTNWSQRSATFNGETNNDSFGSGVSLSDNGNVLAIAAASFSGNGKTYVYQWDGTGYMQQGATIVGEATSDLSGASISLNAIGNTIAIGAYGNDDNGAGSGHVRVFENLSLGINNVSQTLVNFFPNPSTDTVSINVSESIDSVTVYTILGQKILEVKGRGTELELDLSNQPSGNYLATIQTQSSVQTIKLIKI
jgi:hypothetical protein